MTKCINSSQNFHYKGILNIPYENQYYDYFVAVLGEFLTTQQLLKYDQTLAKQTRSDNVLYDIKNNPIYNDALNHMLHIPFNGGHTDTFEDVIHIWIYGISKKNRTYLLDQIYHRPWNYQVYQIDEKGYGLFKTTATIASNKYKLQVSNLKTDYLEFTSANAIKLLADQAFYYTEFKTLYPRCYNHAYHYFKSSHLCSSQNDFDKLLEKLFQGEPFNSMILDWQVRSPQYFEHNLRQINDQTQLSSLSNLF